MHAADGGERMRERMGGAEILLECDRSHSGGDEHFPARIDIVSIAICTRQGIDNHVNGFQRDAVTERMEHWRSEGFNGVRERISAGGGREFGRKAARNFGVEKNEVRQESRMKENRLFLSFFENDYGTATHFAARSGSGRNGDARREVEPIIFPIELGEVQLWLLNEKADRFACVKRAATAESNDPVAIVFAIGLGSAHDILFDRIRVHAGKNKPIFVALCCAQSLLKNSECFCVDQSGICHDERSFYSKPKQSLR